MKFITLLAIQIPLYSIPKTFIDLWWQFYVVSISASKQLYFENYLLCKHPWGARDSQLLLNSDLLSPDSPSGQPRQLICHRTKATSHYQQYSDHNGWLAEHWVHAVANNQWRRHRNFLRHQPDPAIALSRLHGAVYSTALLVPVVHNENISPIDDVNVHSAKLRHQALTWLAFELTMRQRISLRWNSTSISQLQLISGESCSSAAYVLLLQFCLRYMYLKYSHAWSAQH